jgi:LuxR family maltose regulon positive regulatory protein
VSELHASDLRFTPDEAAAFLNQVMGLSLNAADLAALKVCTEGWVAGLQLAALAMRDHQDRSGFIRSFRGSNCYIVDYLAAEVSQSLVEPQSCDELLSCLCSAIDKQSIPPQGMWCSSPKDVRAPACARRRIERLAGLLA